MNDDLPIIDLTAEREKRQPHISGKARCLDCRHEWVAVAPVGVTWMECPSCSLLRARYVYPIREAKQHWICQCGNDLFHILVDGCYCPNCGVVQKGF